MTVADRLFLSPIVSEVARAGAALPEAASFVPQPLGNRGRTVFFGNVGGRLPRRIPGPFISRVLWCGSRADWQQKIAKVRHASQAWPAAAEERARLRILPAPTLDVLYHI